MISPLSNFGVKCQYCNTIRQFTNEQVIEITIHGCSDELNTCNNCGKKMWNGLFVQNIVAECIKDDGFCCFICKKKLDWNENVLISRDENDNNIIFCYTCARNENICLEVQCECWDRGFPCLNFLYTLRYFLYLS